MIKLIVLLSLLLGACQTFQKEDTSRMWWLNQSTTDCICDPELGYYCGCGE